MRGTESRMTGECERTQSICVPQLLASFCSVNNIKFSFSIMIIVKVGFIGDDHKKREIKENYKLELM